MLRLYCTRRAVDENIKYPAKRHGWLLFTAYTHWPIYYYYATTTPLRHTTHTTHDTLVDPHHTPTIHHFRGSSVGITRSQGLHCLQLKCGVVVLMKVWRWWEWERDNPAVVVVTIRVKIVALIARETLVDREVAVLSTAEKIGNVLTMRFMTLIKVWDKQTLSLHL